MAWAEKMSLGCWLSLFACLVVNAATGFELEFLTEPSSRLVKMSDGRAVFRCEVSPSSAEIQWLWNGQPLVPNRYIKIVKHKLTVHMGKNDKNSKFLYSSENGSFQCEARLRGKSLLSSPAELIIAVLESFPLQNDIHLTVIKGNTAVIPCDPPHSVPTVVTEFLFNHLTIDKSSDRMLLLPSGNLQILDTNLSDSGEYICIAYNPYLSEKKQALHKIILHVIEQTKPVSLEFIISPPQKTTAVLGSNITLECAATSYPSASITWQRHQHNLPHLRHQQVAGNLLLISIRRVDEGTYSCIAENSQGKPLIQSTVLEVYETPQIVKPPKNEVMEEGATVVLNCAIRGHPKPEVTWFHNGKVLSFDGIERGKDSQIILRNVTFRHSGIYQCFAQNKLGTVYASSFLKIISDNKSLDFDYNADDDYDYDSEDTIALHHRKDLHLPSGNHHGKHHSLDGSGSTTGSGIDLNGKHHRKKKKHKGVKLIPPSKPEITRLSDTSVMVRWNVPRNDGLPILFFKVQYREIGRRSHDWMTVDEDIAAHIHSYAVTDLRNGGKYRFRIAAVYSNNDNKLGANSAKFVLHKDSPMKKPSSSPIITHAEAASPSAITLFWEYRELDSIPIEGFFIYYRNAHSAGDYLKVTVLGANTRSHIISHLLPNTGYDIKMQCFNMAGTSEFSNIYTSKTKPSENDEVWGRNGKTHQINDDIAIIPGTEPVSSKDGDRNIVLNIVLGVISAAMLIAFTVFGVVYIKQRISRPRNDQNNIPVKACNGHSVTNGYIPVDKMSISVNPLSELDSRDKLDQDNDNVSNNNEVITLQTFNSNESPQLEPLLAQATRESIAGGMIADEVLKETVILPSNTENNVEGPRSI